MLAWGLQRARRGGATEARSISVARIVQWRAVRGAAPCPSSNATAAGTMRSNACANVVSGGVVCRVACALSKPIKDTSRGQARPSVRKACSAPSAISSLAQKTAVGRGRRASNARAARAILKSVVARDKPFRPQRQPGRLHRAAESSGAVHRVL